MISKKLPSRGVPLSPGPASSYRCDVGRLRDDSRPHEKAQTRAAELRRVRPQNWVDDLTARRLSHGTNFEMVYRLATGPGHRAGTGNGAGVGRSSTRNPPAGQHFPIGRRLAPGVAVRGRL